MSSTQNHATGTGKDSKGDNEVLQCFDDKDKVEQKAKYNRKFKKI